MKGIFLKLHVTLKTDADKNKDTLVAVKEVALVDSLATSYHRRRLRHLRKQVIEMLAATLAEAQTNTTSTDCMMQRSKKKIDTLTV